LANSGALFSHNAHWPITGLQKQRIKPYNKQKGSVFIRKSQMRTLLLKSIDVTITQSIWQFADNQGCHKVLKKMALLLYQMADFSFFF